MYSIVECDRTDAIVTFHVATPEQSDELSTHTSFRSPLVEWLEDTLLQPVAAAAVTEL